MEPAVRQTLEAATEDLAATARGLRADLEDMSVTLLGNLVSECQPLVAEARAHAAQASACAERAEAAAAEARASAGDAEGAVLSLRRLAGESETLLREQLARLESAVTGPPAGRSATEPAGEDGGADPAAEKKLRRGATRSRSGATRKVRAPETGSEPAADHPVQAGAPAGGEASASGGGRGRRSARKAEHTDAETALRAEVPTARVAAALDRVPEDRVAQPEPVASPVASLPEQIIQSYRETGSIQATAQRLGLQVGRVEALLKMVGEV